MHVLLAYALAWLSYGMLLCSLHVMFSIVDMPLDPSSHQIKLTSRFTIASATCPKPNLSYNRTTTNLVALHVASSLTDEIVKRKVLRVLRSAREFLVSFFSLAIGILCSFFRKEKSLWVS